MSALSQRFAAYGRRFLKSRRHRIELRYAAEAARGSPLRIEEVDAVLERLGIRRGDHVFIHSRTAILGQVEGGLFALLRLLQDRVGRSGLLLMPTFPYHGPNWVHAQSDPLFDVRKTPSQMGLLSEVFRRLPETVRSLHPTHPVAICGSSAQDWARDHEIDPLPFHEKSPFGRLSREGGKILFMELSGLHVTQVHVAEAELRDEFPAAVYIQPAVSMRVRGYTGCEQRVPVLLHDPRLTLRADPRVFFPRLERDGILRTHYLRGYIPFVAIDAGPLVRFLIDRAREGVTVYNRTTLYGRIKGLLVSRTCDSPPGQLLPKPDPAERRV